MERSQSFRFFNRGPSPAARLVFFTLLSLLLLVVDARFQYLEIVHKALSVMTYPLRSAAALPGVLLRDARSFLELQGNLIQDNAQLRRQHALDAAQLQQLESLKVENQHLRDLFQVQHHADYTAQLAEIVYAERDFFKRKLILDKGSNAGVEAGQVVVDDVGVVGQITRVFPWLAEVTLITDKDHAVPVQVLRNGVRAVVFGSGDTGDLSLRYMPVSVDIKPGDLLVTSGIDGTYTPGLAVARVGRIERDPAYPFLRIQCVPVTGVDRQRQLLILSSLPPQPERPGEESDQGPDKPKRNKKAKP